MDNYFCGSDLWRGRSQWETFLFIDLLVNLLTQIDTRTHARAHTHTDECGVHVLLVLRKCEFSHFHFHSWDVVLYLTTTHFVLRGKSAIIPKWIVQMPQSTWIVIIFRRYVIIWQIIPNRMTCNEFILYNLCSCNSIDFCSGGVFFFQFMMRYLLSWIKYFVLFLTPCRQIPA
jgi:hypothetical protein